MSEHKQTLNGLVLALVALILVNVGMLTWLTVKSQNQSDTADDVIPKIDITVPAQPREPLPEDLDETEKRTISVFREAAPSVVFITSVSVRRHALSRDVMAIPQGNGSGFFWDANGHVVTNYHVVAEGNAARVALTDQSVFPAKIVGTAPDKDIAVLRIEAPPEKIRPIDRGSSADVMVGQRTLAIGNPFGLDYTLSTGVISGLEREIKSRNGMPIFGVIQTDAAINPGNSGGPLLDSRGRLIGINTAIYSPSGASAGIGFAVPVDTVNRIVPQIIEHGRVIRPGLGITFDPALQQRAGVRGILVLGVQPNSAAERAGIRPTTRDPETGALVLGDIIVGIDGKTVEDQNDLFKLLDDKEVGDQVTLRVRRSDKEIDLQVTLAAIDEP